MIRKRVKAGQEARRASQAALGRRANQQPGKARKEQARTNVVDGKGRQKVRIHVEEITAKPADFKKKVEVEIPVVVEETSPVQGRKLLSCSHSQGLSQ